MNPAPLLCTLETDSQRSIRARATTVPCGGYTPHTGAEMREYKYGKARTILPTTKTTYTLTSKINNKHNNKHIYDSSGVQPSKRSAVAKLISSSGRLPLQPKTTSFELPT